MKASSSATSRGRADSPSASTAPVLPKLARARGGAEFDPSADRWSWRDSLSTVSLDFAPLRDLLAPELIEALKATMVWYAEVHSPNTLGANQRQVLRFLRAVVGEGSPPLNSIRGVDLLNYKASLSTSEAHYLGRVGSVLRRWDRLGLPGVKDAVSLLDDLRIGGGIKGMPVITMCPVIGPFTNLEQEAVQAAVDEAFADGAIGEEHYLLTWLLLALGQRPIQYAALKVCDLSRVVSADGTQAFMLNVPRAKQHENPRTSFKERHLIPQIGRPLWNYAQRVRKRYAGLLPDPGQAPMFPQRRPGALAKGFEYHYTAGSLTAALREVLAKLNVVSERTGERMNIAPIRFRRTFGTRAAQEGHGELVIAELLDHTDTQHVGVYVASVPEIAARIDRAVATELAPLAQAFKGMVIESEAQATRGADPSSRIRDLRIDRGGHPMGSCGQHAHCGFARPVACYTCRSFEPWLDGPHESVLHHLLARRESQLARLGPRMASINDRAILAVTEVVELCRVMRKERAQQ